MSDPKMTWVLYAVLSAFFAALTTILAKLGVQGVSSNLATAIRTVVILIIAWGWIFVSGEVSGLGSLAQRTLLFLVLSGVATGLSWLFYFRALQVGPTSSVAAIDKSSLALVLLLSAILLGEALSWRTVLGAALIIGGTLVVIL